MSRINITCFGTLIVYLSLKTECSDVANRVFLPLTGELISSSCLEELGRASYSKSLISHSGAAEFAKRFSKEKFYSNFVCQVKVSQDGRMKSFSRRLVPITHRAFSPTSAKGFPAVTRADAGN